VPSGHERQSLTLLLQDLGHAIIGLPSAETFLSRLGVWPPSCVIADVDLPGLSGLELLKELTARQLTVPTILIGTHGSIRGAVMALRSGARDYFDKPLRHRALYKAVSAIVRTRPIEATDEINPS
jgi:FixJ family two-component response regulator